jgi:lipoprotein NlpD
MLQKFILLLISIYLIGCTSNPPAPVIDRAPNNRPNQTQSKSNNDVDWRPNSYTVKKGDTLYAIGLEFGYDYREIAATNNIAPPYQIKIGQKLTLPNSNTNNTATVGKTNSTTTDDGVVITPITDTPIEAQSSPPSAITPVLTQPQALREAYSDEAYARTAPVVNPVEVVTTTKPSAKPVTPEISSTPPVEIKPADDEAISWAWPTEGKIVSNFNEGSNKGVDIAGKLGQSVNAASSGKVIYSGSDLRGYGKLVIIKHNKTYLSVYAHNNKLLVKEGQFVTSGQKIAEMGSTDATRVKLHFEIRRQGKSVDPARYLNQNQ